MTMISFRATAEDAASLRTWADRLAVDRSVILRDALADYLSRLQREADAETWSRRPLTEEELAIAAIADWGPAEDWADWADATR